jgi:hypothetical protein
MQFHRLRFWLSVGIASPIQPRTMRRFIRNILVNMCMSADATLPARTFETVPSTCDQQGRKTSLSASTVAERHEAARSLVGSARLVPVPRPLATLAVSHICSKHSLARSFRLLLLALKRAMPLSVVDSCRFRIHAEERIMISTALLDRSAELDCHGIPPR